MCTQAPVLVRHLDGGLQWIEGTGVHVAGL
jgi:hypothetical protein